MKWLYLTAVLLSLALGGVYVWLWSLASNASVSTHGDEALRPGNISIPTLRANTDRDTSRLTTSLLEEWASRPFLDWQEEGKVTMPRVLLAKLALGQDVAAVNQYLLNAEVRGTVGSVGPFHADGDYDFTLAGLTLMLYNFGDSPDVLYPETVDHIVNVLLTEEGGIPVEFTPRILGLPLRDTENHILMTEGSRYLKNHWLAIKGETDPQYNNLENGLQTFLLEYLSRLERAGFHEYNSRPYIGYTLTALLNLHAFADDPVSEAAGRILDRANWEYGLGSLSYRRFPPFRRRSERAADTDLDGDYHTALVKAWMSLRRDGDSTRWQLRSGEHHALWAAFTSYRLPAVTAEWIEEKPREYFAMLGHGSDGSPEVYSGGPGYLITAGGVARDEFNQAVARPTTLLLDDRLLELSGVLRISGEGEDHRQWNNTGVYKRFAVGKRLEIPVSWWPSISSAGWAIYQRNPRNGSRVNVLTYTSDAVSLFYLLPDFDPQTLLDIMMRKNPSDDLLANEFNTYFDETIRYDIDAPKDTWVIQSVSGFAINRSLDSWALLEGSFAD